MKKKTLKNSASAQKMKAMENSVDAGPECCFWFNNGPIVKNLIELNNALKEISDELFDYHTKRADDLVKWVTEVLKNDKAAKILAKAKTKKNAIKAIGKYL